MRHAFSIALSVSLVLAASTASAKPRSLADLPEGEPSLAPKAEDVPRHVGAESAVPGIVVRELDQGFSHSPGVVQRRPFVFGSEEEANQWNSGNTTGSRSCMVALRATDWRPESGAWPTNLSSMAQLYVEFSDKGEPMGGYGPVATFAVHIERLSEAGGSAKLESVDAFVDPWTRGAQIIGRTSMRLAKLADGPGGVRVYGARNGDVMHVIATSPAAKKLPENVAAFAGSMQNQLMFRRSDEAGSSDCGHVRFALRAGAAGGEHAIVTTTLVVSSETIPGTGSATGSAFGSILGVLGGSRQPEPAVQSVTEVRSRPLQMNIGISRTSRDAHPVPSVSFGWAGPATTSTI